MTDIDVIKDAALTIKNISVPIELKEQIADPLYRIGRNLDLLYTTIQEQIRKEEEKRALESAEEAPEENKDVSENGERPDPE